MSDDTLDEQRIIFTAVARYENTTCLVGRQVCSGQAYIVQCNTGDEAYIRNGGTIELMPSDEYVDPVRKSDVLTLVVGRY